jgi:hypothetical protein
VAGIFAAIASGGGGHGTAAGAGIAQYADTYMLLFWIGRKRQINGTLFS